MNRPTLDPRILLTLAAFTALGPACNLLVTDPVDPEPTALSPASEVEPTSTSFETEGQEAADTAPTQTAPASQGDPVVGTIQATLDGEPRTWYVLRTDRPDLIETTAGWFYIPDAPEIPFVGITGFEDKDVPFETFVFDELAGFTDFGSYTKSVIGIGFQFDPDQPTVSYQYPYEGPALAGGVTYRPNAGDLSNSGSFGLTDGFLEVEFASGVGQDLSMMQGTFAGTMFRLDHNELLDLSDGQFQVEVVNFFEYEFEE